MFLKEILQSDSQQGSFSRFSGLLIILALISWASVIVYHNNVIPDIPYFWGGMVLGLYGINKSIEGIQKCLEIWRDIQNGKATASETPKE